jgi:hypothetical protein
MHEAAPEPSQEQIAQPEAEMTRTEFKTQQRTEDAVQKFHDATYNPLPGESTIMAAPPQRLAEVATAPVDRQPGVIRRAIGRLATRVHTGMLLTNASRPGNQHLMPTVLEHLEGNKK